MKGPAGYLLTATIKQLAGASQHFLRGFAGKCQQQYGRRRNPQFHQVGDPVGQGARFAATGAGDDKKRPLRVLDCLELR